MTDKITVEIPVDKAREIVSKYPDSCYIKPALEKYDSEHKQYYLGPISHAELQDIQDHWSGISVFTPYEWTMARIARSPVEAPQPENKKRWFHFSQEEWDKLPVGQDFAVCGRYGNVWDLAQRYKCSATLFQQVTPRGSQGRFPADLLEGTKVMPLNPGDPYPTIKDFE